MKTGNLPIWQRPVITRIDIKKTTFTLALKNYLSIIQK